MPAVVAVSLRPLHPGRLDDELMAVTLRVGSVLGTLPKEVTPVNLEELRRVKQLLVELESKADLLRSSVEWDCLPRTCTTSVVGVDMSLWQTQQVLLKADFIADLLRIGPYKADVHGMEHDVGLRLVLLATCWRSCWTIRRTSGTSTSAAGRCARSAGDSATGRPWSARCHPSYHTYYPVVQPAATAVVQRMLVKCSSVTVG
jgi:hypothetical protein